METTIMILIAIIVVQWITFAASAPRRATMKRLEERTAILQEQIEEEQRRNQDLEKMIVNNRNQDRKTRRRYTFAKFLLNVGIVAISYLFGLDDPYSATAIFGTAYLLLNFG